MPSDDPFESELIDDVTRALPFELDEETIDAGLGTASRLEAIANDLYESPEAEPVPHGESDDEYDALLSVYETPRSRDTEGSLSDRDVVIKDNIAVRGLPMTCGSSELSYVPAIDAVVAERLLDAGAAIVGKANLDAFGFGPSGEFSERGTVRNPIADDRVPGGSSSGSGAAVAAGLVDAALGTDTGGSVRIPAACCGIVGAKPTHGLVPRHGLVDFAPSLDTIGPLARDVDTAAEVLDVIAGYDPRDPTSRDAPAESLDAGGALDAATIGLPTAFLKRSDDAVASTIEVIADDLEMHEGVDIRRLDVSLGRIEEAYYLIGATEFAWHLRQGGVTRGQGTWYDEGWRAAFEEATSGDVFSQHVAGRVFPSAYLDAKVDGKAYVAARREAMRFRERLEEAFETVDLLLTPTIRILPPEPGHVTAQEGLDDLLGNTAPFNLTGQPAVSVPVADEDGLPISAQLVAPRMADRRAFRGSRLLESVSTWDGSTDRLGGR